MVELISLKIGNHRQAINTRRAGQDVVIVIRGRDIVDIGQVFDICLHTDDLVEPHEHRPIQAGKTWQQPLNEAILRNPGDRYEAMYWPHHVFAVYLRNGFMAR